ncbi:deaminase domain-containing protein [Pseudomonas frederiksbergensis]|uniref:deaminase domain-containing protein n=1 Tax=Pseudomonas frederiksbergensis TaxID=104087 RepID=UPI00218220DB|nr:deaminase domain-containing protein [Pseudomonas frederiksbergensis]
MDYTQDEIERAVKALDEHSEALRNAIAQIVVPTPDRMAMAKLEMAKLFGRTAFISDGRKLVLEDTDGSGGGTVKVPLLKNPRVVAFSFLDLYVTGKLANGKKWMITDADGKSTGARWIRIDDERRIELRGGSVFDDSTQPAKFGFFPNGKSLPDVGETFETSFKRHLISIKSAYRTLIISLLASLPQADRQAVEQGKIRLLSLRQVTQGVSKEDETAQITLPLRARAGFVLEVSLRQDVFYYEVLPQAGVIRRRPDIDASMEGGVESTNTHDNEGFGAKTNVTVLRARRLPFDWSAHAKGTAPVEGKHCNAILDQVGDTLPTATRTLIDLPPLSSPRQKEVADFIVSNFLYQDEKLLYTAARGRTRFDEIDEEFERKLSFIKSFVPFWSSIEDLMSGDKNKIFAGALGLVVDLASFLYPMGKFISGSARLIKVAATAGRIGTQASLPSFSTLTRKLLVSTLQNLNPLDGIPTLLKSVLTGGGKLTVLAGKTGFRALKSLAGHADQYHLVKGLPQLIEPGRWKPISNGDQLSTVKGIDDVPVRNVSTPDKPLYHLVDPNSAKAYGPRLSTRASALAPGRSSYSTLEKTDSHLLVELSDKSHVREILEIDGRTTMLIDDVPYRLDGDTLRRADLIDDRGFKKIPCRLRRAPGGSNLCRTAYVTRDPAPTPDIGSFDDTKGWAPWFGDSIYTPATGRTPMTTKAMAAHDSLTASMEFQKGIYGRVKVSIPVPEQELVDNLDVGATIVEAMDGSKHYVFTRLDAGDFYVAERLKGQSKYDPLIFKKASTATDAPIDELKVVYTGSLNANNMARIYGTEAVERAMKTMDEIAIPIGGPVNPPDTLKWLKVDTSPGEAILFDHKSRMIVSQLPEGAKSWSRSKVAPEDLRQRTVDIFDTLFQEATIKPKNADSALKIDETMRKLHHKIPYRERSQKPRNIAYAEVTTANGAKEIYVSVSGAQGTTGYLPLFKSNPGVNQVTVGNTTYFNIDADKVFPRTALNVTSDSKVLAVPHTIKNIDTYNPDITGAPTSLDSESKLIRVIREKYPDRESIKSVNVATTMAPCDSCSVVMKQFAYDGSKDGLQVTWR